MGEPEESESVWLDEQAGPVVRPYAMTRGRTRPSRGDFDLISLVHSVGPAPSAEIGLGPEHLTIIRICQRPLSVAEVAAHLDLPVGTVRVMLGDLVDGGFIEVKEPRPGAVAPDEQLFEAVINGLRQL